MNKHRLFRCLITAVLILAVTGCGGKKDEVYTYRAPGTPKGSTAVTSDGAAGEGIQEKEVSDADLLTLYIIERLDTKDKTITVQSVMSGQEFRYDYSLGTAFLNKYETHSPIKDFASGTIVELGDLLDSGALSSVKMTDKVWEYDDIRNFTIDRDRGVMTIDGTSYNMEAYVPIFSGKSIIEDKEVSDEDTLRVYGVNKEILSVAVAKGHGYLSLVNTDLFVDSLVQVGTETATVITGDMSIELPEGKYPVTVANKGYGGTKNVKIKRNKVTTLDLNEMKGEGPKTCELTFKVAAEGANIYLDGEKVKANKTMIVPYGAHTIKVELEGYETWIRKLYVNSKKAEISLDPTDNTTPAKSSTATSSATTNTTSPSSASTEESSTTREERNQTELDVLTTLSDSLANLVSD